MLARNDNVYTVDDKFAIFQTADLDLLAIIYLRMKAEGLLKIFFYEEQPDLAQFLRIMLADGVICLAVYGRGHTGVYDQLLGYGGISKPFHMGGGYYKSEISCLFFKQYQQRNITIPCVQAMVSWTFERTKIHVLVGTTPAPNVAMVRFAKAIGFTLSKIPNFTTWEGKPTAAWISSLSEEEWKSKQ